MTSTRLRLLLLRGDTDGPPTRPEDDPLAPHRSALDVVEVENVAEAIELVRDAPPGSVLLGGRLTDLLEDGLLARSLQHAGEAIGIVDHSGRLTWSDPRLQALGEPMQRRFIECCVKALEHFNQQQVAGRPPEQRPSRRYHFGDEGAFFELVASVASVRDDPEPLVASVVGILVNVTTRRRLQQKVDAIDAAGAELMRMDAGSISRMNMAERLRLLEDKVVRYVHELLRFDNFEIRLLDRETSRLELVVAKGLNPLKIGEVIHARPEGNGISGYVAATGRSYICPDVRRDPLYREGLDDAASSLTVPLRLHDEVIGVFNVESNTPDAFDRDDRQFAEIFGRYVAMAMHILDLLVVERYTTNEQLSSNVLGELSDPIEEIEQRAAALAAHDEIPSALREDLARLHDAAGALRQRVERCTRGPRTILAAEQELQRKEPDPILQGHRVLIADNDKEIRDSLERLLSQKGCVVTVCPNGLDTIAAIEASGEADRPYDLVLSDIKMADRTGYEIFRATKGVEPSTPVILMTGFGYDPHHSIIRASQEGLAALLFKPFKASQLLEAIRKSFSEKAAK